MLISWINWTRIHFVCIFLSQHVIINIVCVWELKSAQSEAREKCPFALLWRLSDEKKTVWKTALGNFNGRKKKDKRDHFQGKKLGYNSDTQKGSCGSNLSWLLIWREIYSTNSYYCCQLKLLNYLSHIMIIKYYDNHFPGSGKFPNLPARLFTRSKNSCLVLTRVKLSATPFVTNGDSLRKKRLKVWKREMLHRSSASRNWIFLLK